MTSYVGIDLGSTSIKAGWLNLPTGEITDVVTVPFPAQLGGLPAGYYEIDPQRVVELVRELLSEVLGFHAVCGGIVVCSQMGGVLLVDEAGKPLTNYLSWRDQRTLESHPEGRGNYLEVARRLTSEDDWDLIGRELKPGGAAALLYWLAEKQQLPPGESRALSLGDYVIGELCQVPPVAESTLALGLLDLQNREWHRSWFEKLGFGRLQWPKLKAVHHRAGEYRHHGSLISVYPAVGDHQTALLGTDLTERELSVNVSTGAQVSLLVRQRNSGDFQTRPYFGGYLLQTITHLPAGRSLNGLVDLLTELPRAAGLEVPDPWGLINDAISRTPETALDVNLAFFSSSVGESGHISNIHLEELNVGCLFRAAVENMAHNFSMVSRQFGTSSVWDRIVLSGGLCQKMPLLRKLLEREIPGPQRLVHTPEETLLGLLKLSRHIESATESLQSDL